MIIEIKPRSEENLEWKEIKKILNYLSKEHDVKFRAKLGDWEIYAVPKEKGEKKKEMKN